MANFPAKKLPPRGFTLVELLVVILILAILGALAASVGQYVMGRIDENITRNTQKILLLAAEAYYGTYTDPVTGRHAYPPIERPEEEFDDLISAGILGSGDAYVYNGWMSGYTLTAYLIGIHYKFPTTNIDGDKVLVTDALQNEPAVQASRAVLRSLPPEALEPDDVIVKDAWGMGMQYDPNGGFNGPVIISAGPSGHFNPWLRTSHGNYQNLNILDLSADDIRSDGRSSN